MRSARLAGDWEDRRDAEGDPGRGLDQPTAASRHVLHRGTGWDGQSLVVFVVSFWAPDWGWRGTGWTFMDLLIVLLDDFVRAGQNGWLMVGVLRLGGGLGSLGRMLCSS